MGPSYIEASSPECLPFQFQALLSHENVSIVLSTHSCQCAGCEKSKLSGARNFDIVIVSIDFDQLFTFVGAAAVCLRVGSIKLHFHHLICACLYNKVNVYQVYNEHQSTETTRLLSRHVGSVTWNNLQPEVCQTYHNRCLGKCSDVCTSGCNHVSEH